jgi:quercetin dioxygenase-like cupin family protein
MLKVALILIAAAVVHAQVPLREDPHHRVTFENAAFRILDVNIAPGATTSDHRHEFDVATISMSSGTPTREMAAQATGLVWGPDRPPRPLGDTAVREYTGKPASHRIENRGKTPYQLFAVENLRQSGWSAAKPASGLATRLATESRAFRIYDVRFTRDVSQTSHTHAVPTLVVLLTGNILSDGPDARAKDFAPAPVGLKQLSQPGQWLLVPAGDSHHVVRLSTADARVVEIEVR